MHMRPSIYVVFSSALSGRKLPIPPSSPHKQLGNISFEDSFD